MRALTFGGLACVLAAGLLVELLGAQDTTYWEEQKSGTTARLRGVSAVTEKVAWASGSAGTVLRTIDGGDHWQLVSPGAASDLDFRDIHGVDERKAYALSIGEGEKSRIYKTTDGGATWKLQFTNREPKGFFDGFVFWDADNGIAFSDPVEGRFLIIRTTDGGSNWTPTPRESMPIALPDEAAFAASGTSIVVAGRNDVWIATGGSAARVFHSTDRGLTWSAAKTPIASGAASAGIFSIYAASTESIVIAGGDYQKEKESSVNFARSKDGGRTWTSGPSLRGYRSAISGIPLANSSYVAVGPSGTDVSFDGQSWIAIGTVGYDALSLVSGSRMGWAAGQNGRIAKFRLPK